MVKKATWQSKAVFPQEHSKYLRDKTFTLYQKCFQKRIVCQVFAVLLSRDMSWSDLGAEDVFIWGEIFIFGEKEQVLVPKTSKSFFWRERKRKKTK